jgi:hypothetical protein
MVVKCHQVWIRWLNEFITTANHFFNATGKYWYLKEKKKRFK